jgi:translation initiation factor IF-2
VGVAGLARSLGKKRKATRVPIRIYAFAKELGFDNKQFMEICEKANVKGKGSALASLDDDEVQIIKDYLKSRESKPAAPVASATSVVPMRPPTRVSPRRISEISSPKSATTALETDSVDEAGDSPGEPDLVETSEGNEAATEPADAVMEKAEASEPPGRTKVSALLERLRSKPEAVKPQAPPAKSPAPAPVAKGETSRPSKPSPTKAPVGGPTLVPRRPMSLNRSSGVRDLDQKPSAPAAESGTKVPAKPRKAGVNLKLAAMPDVKQPAIAKEKAEKIQKPDIALPQEAIAKARVGAAPLESFTKSAKNRVKKKVKGKETVGSEVPDAAGLRRNLRRERGEQDFDGEMGARPSRVGGARRTTPTRRTESRRTVTRRSGASTAAPRKGSVVLQLPCTVREFSEATGLPAVKAIFELQKLGSEGVKNINSLIEDEVVEMLVMQLGLDVELRDAENLEDTILSQVVQEDDPDTLKPRAPIVTFLGHVDHGKTSLLDAIIGLNVVAGEAGGITQHIRAYEIFKEGQKITFVDTPGHEAFTEMRARGANVTDIAVLVVAADDGIMPQTEEAISHARAAGVPIIVALNKIDLPGVSADKAMQDLAAHDLLPSEWGGEIEVVRTSALTGLGLSELLETILFTAEMQNYQANPDRAAYGMCLEAEQQSDRGVVAKLMVQGGTLNTGDVVVCGSSYGRVKAIYDTLNRNKKKKSAEPSTPVNITGFDVAPAAGDKFFVVDDFAQARELAEERRYKGTVERVGGRSTRTSLQDFQSLLETGDLRGGIGEVVTLNLIIRADVRGSIEAIQKELGKISHPEVQIKIIQALPGGISVADVRLADASNAVIVGFNVVADEAARSLADELKVEIRRYEVIYKITDDLKATLEGRLKPEEQVVELGMAMVLRVFSISKSGNVAGCRVMRGTIERDCRLRVVRDSRVIGDYAIESLKREKDDAKEVQRGMECGIKLAGFNDVKEGDTLEAYKIQEVARTL